MTHESKKRTANNHPFQTPDGEKVFAYVKKKFKQEMNWNKLAKPGPHELVLVLDRLKPTYNVGKIIRTAEIFGAKEVRLIGIPFFDPGPTKGACRYIPVKFFETSGEALKELINEGYKILFLSPTTEKNLHHEEMPSKTALIVGHEEFGLSPETKEIEGLIGVKIPQFGKSQSLNASVAVSIATWEYVRQRG
ncbi:MAG: hypothetical protein KDD25_03940 [Bdellovibrionales bacterium]|nr:hypothetical protein [Bdellovibrionales bacterium]